jgi:hypothetical protein
MDSQRSESQAGPYRSADHPGNEEPDSRDFGFNPFAESHLYLLHPHGEYHDIHVVGFMYASRAPSLDACGFI